MVSPAEALSGIFNARFQAQVAEWARRNWDSYKHHQEAVYHSLHSTKLKYLRLSGLGGHWFLANAFKLQQARLGLCEPEVC